MVYTLYVTASKRRAAKETCSLHPCKTALFPLFLLLAALQPAGAAGEGGPPDKDLVSIKKRLYVLLLRNKRGGLRGIMVEQGRHV